MAKDTNTTQIQVQENNHPLQAKFQWHRYNFTGHAQNWRSNTLPNISVIKIDGAEYF